MSKISFVYFDVGGVAVKDFSDTNKWEIMLDHALGIPKNQQAKFDAIYSKYEDDICLGKIEVDDLKPFIESAYNSHLEPNFSLLTYFLDHFELNDELWPIVDLIKKNRPIGLLTDQYLGMLDGIFSQKLIPKEGWSAIVDSSVVGVRKPMPEIYQLAQERAGVPAGEILLIDNRQFNLDGATQAGWQAYLYDSRDYKSSNAKLAEFVRLNL